MKNKKGLSKLSLDDLCRQAQDDDHRVRWPAEDELLRRGVAVRLRCLNCKKEFTGRVDERCIRCGSIGLMFGKIEKLN